MAGVFTTVQPPLGYKEPNFTPWVYRVVKTLSSLYIKLSLGVKEVRVEGMETYLEQYRRFLDGEVRIALAFRHPTVTDPQIVWYLGGRLAEKAARKVGLRFPDVPNLHFLYGRGVPLWAGGFVNWLLPRIGALQLYHRKMDTQGMRTIREAFAGGRFPLALAPEGQVTYHNYRVAALEHGIARMSLWCLDDIRKTGGENKDVIILPVALIYDYTGKDPEGIADSVLSICETECGLESPAPGRLITGKERIRLRVLNLFEHLADTLEAYYSRFFCKQFHETGRDTQALQRRLDLIVKTAQEVSEQLFCITGQGEIIPRIFTVRQAYWDGVFRDDIDSIDGLSPVDKSLADRAAATSFISSRHSELVDNLAYIDLSYIDEPVSMNRLIETALNIYGVIGRIKGGDISSRMRVPSKLVYRIGDPISASEYADIPLKSRKRQIREITDTLYRSLTDLCYE